MVTAEKYIVPLSKKIDIGSLSLGGAQPLVIQTMINTDANDIEASAEQCVRIIKAGGEMIRITTQGKKEVESSRQIISRIQEQYPGIPFVADIHFNAAVALEAAPVFDKVRINPGNYTEKTTGNRALSDEDFESGKSKNREELLLLLDRCRQNNTALRIGINHGSLSKRIISKFGDTPAGMAESAMEFLRFCKEAVFRNVVVSLKSSNTKVMVQSVRLLAYKMISEDLYYPIHLGVTEAGNDLEGRIRSTVGMAPLLLEGIGDTLRVSLTEAPEEEIPVASMIRSLFPKPQHLPYDPFKTESVDPFKYIKPITRQIESIGGNQPPLVLSAPVNQNDGPVPDLQITRENNCLFIIENGGKTAAPGTAKKCSLKNPETYFFTDITSSAAEISSLAGKRIIVLDGKHHSMQEIKNWLLTYHSANMPSPVVFHKTYSVNSKEKFALLAAGEAGSLLIDGLINGLWIENTSLDPSFVAQTSFDILQASRERITTTEFIACPSCGRTLFDIESVLQKVKSATRNFTGLKIAVMGCIVNGPGEMADADYGYIGAGKGKVTLYKHGRPAKKNIPENEAVEALLQLIREQGDCKEN